MPSEHDEKYSRPGGTWHVGQNYVHRRAFTLLGARSRQRLANNPDGYLTWRRNRIHNNLARQRVRPGELWSTDPHERGGAPRPYRRYSQHYHLGVRRRGNQRAVQMFRPQVMRQGIRVPYNSRGTLNWRNFRY